MVRTGEIPPELPATAGRKAARHSAGGALSGSRLLSPEAAAAAVKALATFHGFEACGIAPAAPDPRRSAHLNEWLEAGHAGTMAWLAREPERRAAPQGLWPEAKSAILLGINAPPEADPLALLADRTRAAIATYAQRRDYHDVIKGRLKLFAAEIVRKLGGEVKVFVDTAPVMEKPLAEAAGIGWQGKHTVLLSREFGNWLLLGAVFSTLDLATDTPETEHCGTCRRCLDICPTAAFPAPNLLDSRRCIAYLTIEHQGPIPRELRPKFGNRVFGCDDCLAICPWNKFARAANEQRLAIRPALRSPDLAMLAGLDEAGFRAFFAGTPIKRSGRARVLRNVLIAIGNSGEPAMAAAAEPLLADPEPLLRGAAVWALARLWPRERFRQAATRLAEPEPEAHVREEWALALAEMD